MSLRKSLPQFDARDLARSDLDPLELTLSHMPKWLLDAEPRLIDALKSSMALSHDYHVKVGKQFGELESVEQYCAPLLSAELQRRFPGALDVHHDHVSLVHVHIDGFDPLFLRLHQHLIHAEPKTLLWAALQNFSADEALEGGMHPQSAILKDAQRDRPSPVRPYEFAAACRALDLGLKYQLYLQQFLGVAATGAVTLTAEQSTTHENLQRLKTYDMQVDAHIAFLSKKVSEPVYKTLIALLVPDSGSGVKGTVYLDGKPLVISTLSILDTQVDGIIVFSSDTVLMHPDNRVILYIPNDPETPFCEYASLAQMTAELRRRLLDPTYLRFFTCFIALEAKPAFLQRVSENPEHLFLTTPVTDLAPAEYLVSVQLKNMFADARQLAVPTGVLDAAERERRWQLYKNVGLALVNVAALFVPELGALMLAVAAVKMLGEVFEGVESWARGDIDHAREHFLNVAKDIALTAAVAVGGVVLQKAVIRLSQASKAFLEDFEPVLQEDGSARLWNKNLEPYEANPKPGPSHEPDALGIITVDDKHYVEVDGKTYQVRFDQTLKQWRTVHPNRINAFQPALLHNQQGAWQHAHEWPLEWQGSSTLIGRLGRDVSKLEPQALRCAQKLTDTSEDVMRRVHLEHLAPPLLLSDTLERFVIDRKITRFISQMSSGLHNDPEAAELQLRLLPLLPRWPQGKGLQVGARASQNISHYGHEQWATTSRIELPETVLKQGRVLESVLEQLSAQQRQVLLATEDGTNHTALLQTLVRMLGEQAQQQRWQLFEGLYARFNRSTLEETRALERAFPGLPKRVAQRLAETANEQELLSLRSAKVPLTLAEHARLHLHDVRLNRAFEGFYLQSLDNPDTLTLARHFSPRLPGWPADIQLEVREHSVVGKVLCRWGDESSSHPQVLVKTAHRYRRYQAEDQLYRAVPGSEACLFEALLSALPEVQSPVSADVESFAGALAEIAIKDRDESARVLGMQRLNRGFRAPSRMPDGRVGYPLCGLSAVRYQRGLQRRVRALYPDFTDEQVVEYLDALVEGGLDPLSVVRGRKREGRALVQSLQTWLDAAMMEMPSSDTIYDYADGRFEMGHVILQAWKRNPEHIPWATDEAVYSVNLDGLRVGDLPVLPANIRLSHIHELSLSNLNCRDTADNFLSHFPSLTKLEMDNNRMTHLPQQLTQMPNLRRLSMARNLLRLQSEDIKVINQLSELETLNLNDNSIGPLLDLSLLPKLRRVSLRRTLIEEWPPGLITRPLLQSADLRDNAIVEIPEQVYQAPTSVSLNVTLSGNPLSAASRLRLARSILQGGDSMGIHSEELLTQAAAFEFWTGGVTGSEARQRETLWNQLQADPAADDFFVMLSRLTVTADAQSVRQDLSRRVWEMIESAAQSSTLRQDLFDLAASPRSCTDSVALTFSALEVQVELARVATHGSPRKDELIKLARRLFRLDQVQKIAAEHYSASLESGGPSLDELEVHLAYRVGLAQTLDLPGQPWSMQFKSLAGVSPADLKVAKTRVEMAEKSPELQRYVSTRDFWRDYVASAHKAEFNTRTGPFYEELNGLLRRSPDMSSERYLNEASGVRRHMEETIDQWYLEKTYIYLPGAAFLM
ncbi:NEL-type E3 ubiquitin ligase domain-containing protein [Pseudomonas mucidolens]|nr:NEL-type E3 ubiquitin ligase domain-containing protein [Pseudomonas mucidolens]